MPGMLVILKFIPEVLVDLISLNAKKL